MEIREITDQSIWEAFLRECEEKTFLHSWTWGEFQKAMREKIWRLGFFEGNVLIAIALVVRVKAKRGRFLLIPHGPVIKVKSKNEKVKILEVLVEFLRKIAREEEASFIRINPICERTKENEAVFSQLRFRRAPIQMHPEASWKLDLNPSEEELFSRMRKTTRYLVRQAQKNPDISIEKTTDSAFVQTFAKLHRLVSQRQNFIPFSYEYLEREFSLFSKEGQVMILVAKVKGEVAAASFVLFWSNIAFYHHAASLPAYAKLALPYALQWEAVKEAKRRGCTIYDFWGYVDPFTHASHPWAGPTLFKMGFGGRAHEYVKTQDFPLKTSYWITYGFETLRRVRRGL